MLSSHSSSSPASSAGSRSTQSAQSGPRRAIPRTPSGRRGGLTGDDPTPVGPTLGARPSAKDWFTLCGIAVVHDLRPDLDRLRAGRLIGEDMLARLHHRGPDGSGTRQVGPTWLGHTRLAIVDLDGGEQPLRSPDGDRWVVANGEIYNHDALRSRLGGPFVTDSDSEVVLHVVDRLGVAASTTCAGCTPSAQPPGTATSSLPATRWGPSRSTGPGTTTGCWPPPSCGRSRSTCDRTSRSSRPATTGLRPRGCRPSSTCVRTRSASRRRRRADRGPRPGPRGHQGDPACTVSANG